MLLLLLLFGRTSVASRCCLFPTVRQRRSRVTPRRCVASPPGPSAQGRELQRRWELRMELQRVKIRREGSWEWPEERRWAPHLELHQGPLLVRSSVAPRATPRSSAAPLCTRVQLKRRSP